ncbi:alanyl-tRNA synthetase [Allocatelliglobosispora scoriae]|uniref:Alanine--tRNA ligase n=1 Tax=Allocatelliglobosispora scoriae TaxID=643052 RepID=A0A841C1V0_9ACTN|nr:alanine--tRNA ligase [Allocatelliglobosispora scoriae]MBB5873123.1 alanyl-tRNA synthetase [Allocatelliglobosispora scoriae]
MRTAEIKRRFLAHFEAQGHTVVPSAPLPAIDDPNLLFVNAGMVQFVPYFLGQQPAPWKRAVSVQKCIRTPDIDEVGKTSRHGTFFQMNGNFSFGDYFKEEAIPLSWDLITKPVAEGGFGIDPDKVWATVYLDDDESIEIWRKTGMPLERIVRRGKADNFWSMGIPGPCGPCSEIYVDRGPSYGREGGPEVDEDRYMEIWNNVFMQYERGPGTDKENYPILGELPAKNIDTGMGLERMASIMQGVDNLYEIDEVRPLIDKACELTGKRYNVAHTTTAAQSHPDDVKLRVIADHVRTALMLIGDGVTPANDGRGYVLRRIMRRSIRAVRLLGFHEPVLPHLLPVARDAMAPSYPELATDFERISQYAYAEEATFLETLKSGTTILDVAIADTKKSGGAALPGDKAFQLHDTYGFPIDLTLEIAAEQGLTVDQDGFRRLMAEQRTRAKADAQARKTGHADLSAYRAALDDGGAVEFTGYAEVSRESRVRALLSSTGATLRSAGEGDELELVLDSTPFYAEGGGQQADTGVITVGGGKVEVYDVQQPMPGLYVHKVRVVSGEVRAGEAGFAEIDVLRRKAISRAHTATHLVHQTMRAFLGETATQAGSLNAPGRLRFDFNTPGAVPSSVLHDVEQQINEVLLEDLEVRAFITSQAEARAMGAMALFGEKYGEKVRVVEVGDYARELCGGTHTERSGQLGLVKILSESSIGSGVRRVEALVGLDAFRYLAKEHLLVSRLAELYRVPNEQVADRVEQTVTQLADAERELGKLRAQMVLAGAGALAAGALDLDGVAYVGTEAPEGAAVNDVRTLAQEVRGQIPADRPAVVAVVSRANGKASLIVAVNGTGKARGLDAGALVKGALSGRGGGNADLAQGGGVPADEAPKLLASVERALRSAA